MSGFSGMSKSDLVKVTTVLRVLYLNIFLPGVVRKFDSIIYSIFWSLYQSNPAIFKALICLPSHQSNMEFLFLLIKCIQMHLEISLTGIICI